MDSTDTTAECEVKESTFFVRQKHFLYITFSGQTPKSGAQNEMETKWAALQLARVRCKGSRGDSGVKGPHTVNLLPGTWRTSGRLLKEAGHTSLVLPRTKFTRRLFRLGICGSFAFGVSHIRRCRHLTRAGFGEPQDFLPTSARHGTRPQMNSNNARQRPDAGGNITR